MGKLSNVSERKFDWALWLKNQEIKHCYWLTCLHPQSYPKGVGIATLQSTTRTKAQFAQWSLNEPERSLQERKSDNVAVKYNPQLVAQLTTRMLLLLPWIASLSLMTWNESRGDMPSHSEEIPRKKMSSNLERMRTSAPLREDLMVLPQLRINRPLAWFSYMRCHRHDNFGPGSPRFRCPALHR